MTSFKEKVEKELASFKTWAQEANMQAHLKKSEVSADLRTSWMEAEQNMAKLEAKLEGLTEQADEAADQLLSKLKEKRDEMRKSLGL